MIDSLNLVRKIVTEQHEQLQFHTEITLIALCVAAKISMNKSKAGMWTAFAKKKNLLGIANIGWAETTILLYYFLQYTMFFLSFELVSS